MTVKKCRRIPKPWGFEDIWAETDYYVAKRMRINPGKRMSLQYHEIKEETIFVLDGVLRIWTTEEDDKYTDLKPGEIYHVNPKQIHRFGSPPGKYGTLIMEVSTPHLKDVIRLVDDYSRE